MNLLFPQILFNTTLYLMGSIFLATAFRSEEKQLSYLLAFPTGIALWATSTTLLLILHIKISILAVLMLFSAIIALAFAIAGKHNSTLYSKKNQRLYFLKYLTIFIFLNIAIYYFWGSTFLTPDSGRYTGLGVTIARSGYYPADGLMLTTSEVAFFNTARMSFLASLEAGSCLFGVDFYNTLYPIASVTFLLAIAKIFHDHLAEQDFTKKERLTLAAILPVLILSIPLYRYHSMYVNQNLLTTIFFTLSIFFIMAYKQTRQIRYIILGAFYLAQTILLRPEMPLFCLIPISCLIQSKELKSSEYLWFLLVFLAVALPWQIFKLSWAVGSEFNSSAHNSIAALITQCGSIGAVIIIYFFYFAPWIRNRIFPYSLSILLMLLALIFFLFLFLKSSDTVLSMKHLCRLLFRWKYQFDRWGAIWYFLIAALPMRFLIRNAFVKDLLKIVLAFFIVRLIIYSLGTYANPYGSGARILLHIIPTCVIYIVYVGIGPLLAGSLNPYSIELKE